MSSSNAYKSLFAIMLVTLFSVAGIAMPYPILAPLMLDEAANNLNQFLGIHPKLLLAGILAAYPLGMLLGSAILGPLSDSIGRKKTLLYSTLGSVASYLIAALAIFEESFLLLLMARLVTGLCEGNVAVARAVAADLHPVIDKTRSLSWIYAVMYSGWFFGPLLGGFLMAYGAEVAFLVAGLLSLIAVVFIGLFINETNPSTLNSNIESGSFWDVCIKQNSFTLLQYPIYRHVFVQYLLIMLGLNAFYEFFPLWLFESFHFSSMQIGYATALQTMAMVLVSALLLERLKNAFDNRAVITVGLIAFAILLCGIGFIDESLAWWFFAATGISIAVFNGLLPIFYSDQFANDESGKLFGLITSTFCLGSILIAIIGGAVSLYGAIASIVLGGLLLTLGMFYFLLIAYHPRFVTMAEQV